MKYSSQFLKLREMLNSNQHPDAWALEHLLALKSSELTALRQKVKDAIRNKVSVEALKRNSKKWTCEARNECLRAWDEELKPLLIAKRQRDNTKQSQMIMTASESFCFDFDSEESKKISLIKLIQCISDDVTDWQKLNVFKKGLKAF